MGACNPFERAWAKVDGACSEKLQFRKRRFNDRTSRNEPANPDDEIPSHIAYRDSCPICKIYGNTFLLGRFSVYDAYSKPGVRPRTERRDMVGIDRFTGGSSAGAKFDAEMVTEGAFKTQIRLTNFELWHLGLVAFVLRDFAEGLAPIGGGKSRGLGRVTARINSVEVKLLKLPSSNDNSNQLFGMYATESDQDRAAYGYWEGEAAGVELEGYTSEEDVLGLRAIYRLEGDSVTNLWRKAAPLAAQRLQQYQIPESMNLA